MTREAELHTAIIRHVADRGFAPSQARLAEQLGWPEPEVRAVLQSLAGMRGLILS